MGADVQLPPCAVRAHARSDLVRDVFSSPSKRCRSGKETGELETECRNGSDHVSIGCQHVLDDIEFCVVVAASAIETGITRSRQDTLGGMP